MHTQEVDKEVLVMAERVTTPTPWGLRLFPFLTMSGWILILIAFIIGAAILAPSHAGYWGDHSKADRNAAAAGSELLGELNEIKTFPRWVAPMKFLGVAAFMVGIALEFATIPRILNRRGDVLSRAVPVIARAGADARRK